MGKGAVGGRSQTESRVGQALVGRFPSLPTPEMPRSLGHNGNKSAAVERVGVSMRVQAPARAWSAVPVISAPRALLGEGAGELCGPLVGAAELWLSLPEGPCPP